MFSALSLQGSLTAANYKMRFSKFVSLKGIFFGLRFKEFFQPCPYKVPWQRRITKWMKWDDERLNPRHSCLICPPNFLCALTCYFCFQNLSCLSHWIDMAEAAIVYRCYAMVFIGRSSQLAEAATCSSYGRACYLHYFWNIQFRSAAVFLVWIIASHCCRPEKISNLSTTKAVFVHVFVWQLPFQTLVNATCHMFTGTSVSGPTTWAKARICSSS